MKKAGFVIKELFNCAAEHNLTAYSAQMAYFFLLSIFPFLIMFFAILGRLEITYDVFSSAYMQVVPTEAYALIDGYIKYLLAAKLEAVLPVSLLASLWMASKAVNALERALNQAHEVPQPRKYLYGRFLGMVVTILLMLILMIALTLPSMGSSFVVFLQSHMSLPESLLLFLSYGRWLMLPASFTLILAMTYSLLPNIRLRLREVMPGVVFTMIGWIFLSLGFSYFIRFASNISFVYGSLGTVITLMIWLYWVSILIMLGAELNAALIKWRKLCG